MEDGKLHPDPFTQIRADAMYPIRACTRYGVEEQQRIALFVELLRGLHTNPREVGFLLLGIRCSNRIGPIRSAALAAKPRIA
jgi:hypothetical protein